MSLALVVSACASDQRPSLPKPALQPTRLEAPFDVASSRAAMGAPAAGFVCADPPKPARDGGEGERSKLDELVRAIADMSDAYVRANPADPSPARCALDWLDAWALEEALLDRPRRAEARIARERALAGLSLAYLKIRDEESLPRDRKELVEAWLAAVAHATLSGAIAGAIAGEAGAIAHDRVYWAALAAAASGVASGDRGLLDWGIARCRAALAEHDAIGALTLRDELQILTPLVMTAELAAANRVDLYAEHDRAIDRRIGRVRGVFDDGGRLRIASGREPFAGAFSGALFAWGELYVARFPDPFLSRWVAMYRPLSNPWLGGDVTLIFAPRRALR